MVLGVAFALAATSAGAPENNVGGRTRLIHNVRVCTKTAFNQSQYRCTRDQRRHALTSSFFACSADILVRHTSVLQLQWTYGRANLPPFTVTVTGRHRRHSLTLDLGADLPLPGGKYRCSFSLGHAVKAATFTSAGPAGEAVDVVACDGANTIASGGFLVCRSDQSGTPFRAPSSIMCNAVYPNAKGKTSTIEMLRDSQLLKQPRESRISEPLWQVKDSFAAPSGQTLANGNYECRFSLNGTIVADKQFQVVS
jgi:hypothetical protein